MNRTTTLLCALLIHLVSARAVQAAQTACEHGICFRLPTEDPVKFFAPGKAGFGPFLMDHREAGDPSICKDYLGEGFDNCYGGHSGSDFMLIGGFRAMTGDVPVVAAARGEVIGYDDSNYDHCHGSVLALLGDGEGISCGIDPETGKPRPITNNYVRIRHWNGHYYVYSIYMHLMQDSVPTWIKEALAAGQFPTIECGELIGFVGSAGKSFSPHIHFGVKYREGDVEGDYVGVQPIDPYCGPFSGSSRSMWTDLATPDGLPGTTCQDPYDPWGPLAPQGGTCFEAASSSSGAPPVSVAPARARLPVSRRSAASGKN